MCHLPTFCLRNVLSPVLGGRQGQLRRFRFRSLMEIKCHGNILASNRVLICHNVHVCALNQPLLNGSIWTQALVLGAAPNLHEIRPRVHEGRPRVFVFFFFYVFIFGQGQEIDDA